ncbi:uncharacterized protein N0V89_001694 [Didymosphaeria variabile]|uniref:Polyketide synthase n=1 Tax=Didymosphaeria variabile TaxID=1932322 RepID=A0A9W8XYW0_9PLEO|nr:uncharacterized protein N0V89_001694 [Didymosphaeria variabile]KAJ4361125.1 hypothetical protein N0V89_001694 [Didymosphaeria variabile]
MLAATLIRDTYRRAGLDPLCDADRPQYFEAHGTGTPAGDPIEAEAIHSAFFGDKDATDGRLWVGSIKTVCGHTEGTAGIAGLMKASLALQQGVVPPNLLFNRLNPRIEHFTAHLQVPRRAEPWPKTQGRPRRAGVNNFGFGGTNCFALLEAYGQPSATTAHDGTAAAVPFLFSAASEKALSRYLEAFAAFVEANEQTVSLRDLAYTLHIRRSRLQYATAVAASDARELYTRLREKLQAASSGSPVGVRAQLGRDIGIVAIFTGQGAQWPRMGAGLLKHSPVVDIIADLEGHLSRLPPSDRPQWSLRQELERGADSSRVGEAELSQPLCTALQIVLVDLLRAAGITFTAVVGHSSGEIAAAYAANVLSAHDAIAIAYYRGMHTKLAGSQGHRGAMLAAGVTAEDASELLESPVFEGRATIAAYNASSSLTLAGDADAIEELQAILEDEDKFARLLKVDKAYHSHHMAPVAGPYADSLRALNIQVSTPTCTWISSVSGKNILDHGLDSLSHQYWVDNAVNPVLFMQAVQKTAADLGSGNNLLALEVGPHPALQGPATQTIRETTGADIPYTGLLKRGARDNVAVPEGLGHIWTHLGQPSLDLQAFDYFMSEKAPRRLVKDLPTYAWDHHVDYWHESRYTKASMSRPRVHELLGHMTSDASVEQELRWRQILSPSEIPWLGGHRLQSQIVFPAAGYVVLAIEACRELLALVPAFGPAKLIQVHDVNIQQALTFDSDDSRVEAIFALNNITREADIVSANFKYSAASSGTGHGLHNDSQLRVLTSGYVKISLGESSPQTLPARGPSPDSLLPVRAEEFYESLEKMEYEYSGEFRALSGLERKLGAVTGCVAGPSKDLKSELLVHPGMLDAAFQAVLLAKAAPFDGSLWSMHVPKTIDRITVNPCTSGSHVTSGQQLPFSSYLQNRMADSSFKGDVDVYPPRVRSFSASDESSHAMVQVEGLDCVPFSPPTAQDDREIMSVMVWDSAFPDAGKAAYDLRPIPDPRELELARFLERLSYYYLKQLQDSIPLDHPSRKDGQPLSKLFSFAKYVDSRIASGQLPFWKEEWFQDTQASIAAASKPFAGVADYKLLTRIGEKLPEIVEGKTSAIELTMKDDLLNDFYPVALGMAHHTKYLARTVKQITHRYPHMKILEIGAGTGGATKAILDMVGDSFSSYTFTDISAGFFLRAQEQFSSFPSSSRLAYKVLDISKDPLQQGYAEKAYDLIVASQVLHATPVMRQSLLNTRRLLKPGGYLVVNEGINNDTARLGTIFGAFPGWWLGAENDGRSLGPNLAVSEWNELLRGTGFSGCDSQVAVIDPLLTPNTVFVSQAVDARVNFLRDPLAVSPQALQLLNPATEPSMQELLIIGGEKATSAEIVSRLEPLLKKYFARMTHLRSLADVAALNVHVSSQTTILSLSDIDKPMFQDLTERDLRSMKYLLHNAGSVLWITQGRRAQDPFANSKSSRNPIYFSLDF